MEEEIRFKLFANFERSYNLAFKEGKKIISNYTDLSHYFKVENKDKDKDKFKDRDRDNDDEEMKNEKDSS